MKIKHSYYLMGVAVVLPFIVAAFCLSQARPIVRIFPAQGVRRVVLRCFQAKTAQIIASKSVQIKISGVPTGEIVGYHTHDPSWRPTRAQDWGLDFVSRRFGDTLVVASKQEVAIIHHHFELANVTLQVPANTVVEKSGLDPFQAGKPDLRPPQ